MVHPAIAYHEHEVRTEAETICREHGLPLRHDRFGNLLVEINKGVGDSPYMAIGHLVFNTMNEMQKGLQAHDPELAADVANFTDAKPEFQISEIL